MVANVYLAAQNLNSGYLVHRTCIATTRSNSLSPVEKFDRLFFNNRVIAGCKIFEKTLSISICLRGCNDRSIPVDQVHRDA